MRKTIWKYPIEIEDVFSLDLPEQAKVLCIANQYESAYIWVELTEDAIESPPVPRRFRLVGTGHYFDENELDPLNYVGSFQMLKGALVFHLYEFSDTK